MNPPKKHPEPPPFPRLSAFMREFRGISLRDTELQSDSSNSPLHDFRVPSTESLSPSPNVQKSERGREIESNQTSASSSKKAARHGVVMKSKIVGNKTLSPFEMIRRSFERGENSDESNYVLSDQEDCGNGVEKHLSSESTEGTSLPSTQLLKLEENEQASKNRHRKDNESQVVCSGALRENEVDSLSIPRLFSMHQLIQKKKEEKPHLLLCGKQSPNYSRDKLPSLHKELGEILAERSTLTSIPQETSKLKETVEPLQLCSKSGRTSNHDSEEDVRESSLLRLRASSPLNGENELKLPATAASVQKNVNRDLEIPNNGSERHSEKLRMTVKHEEIKREISYTRDNDVQDVHNLISKSELIDRPTRLIASNFKNILHCAKVIQEGPNSADAEEQPKSRNHHEQSSLISREESSQTVMLVHSKNSGDCNVVSEEKSSEINIHRQKNNNQRRSTQRNSVTDKILEREKEAFISSSDNFIPFSSDPPHSTSRDAGPKLADADLSFRRTTTFSDTKSAFLRNRKKVDVLSSGNVRQLLNQNIESEKNNESSISPKIDECEVSTIDASALENTLNTSNCGKEKAGKNYEKRATNSLQIVDTSDAEKNPLDAGRAQEVESPRKDPKTNVPSTVSDDLSEDINVEISICSATSLLNKVVLLRIGRIFRSLRRIIGGFASSHLEFMQLLKNLTRSTILRRLQEKANSTSSKMLGYVVKLAKTVVFLIDAFRRLILHHIFLNIS